MEYITVVLSGLSIVISILSYFQSIKSQKLQGKVNEIELKLKEYELAEKEKEQQRKTCVEASICNRLNNNYKIKIWNSGNTIAKNIMVSWDETEEIIPFDVGKLPYELLEPQKSFELSISIFEIIPSKLWVKTEWEDDIGEKHSKKQLCDL